MTPERVTVLADEVIPVAELSRAEAERRLAAAQADYDAAGKIDVPAEDAAMDRIQSAQAMLEAARRKRPERVARRSVEACPGHRGAGPPGIALDLVRSGRPGFRVMIC